MSEALDRQGQKKHRAEGWFTPNQINWLRTLSRVEDRSQSSILRAALNLYIRQRIEQAAERRG